MLSDASGQNRALVAINLHPFHDLAALPACLDTTAASIRAANAAYPDAALDGVLFWHRPDPVPYQIAEHATALGIQIQRWPHHSNGENLNRQIDFAHASGRAFFFRVDADDTVAPARFGAQMDVLIAREADICGAGLLYIPEGGAAYPVLPRETPRARDFIENCFVLHPTMAIFLPSIAKAGIRYDAGRLEDKAMLSRAVRAGLVIRNLPMIAGTYKLGPQARTGVAQKWRSCVLNLAFATRMRAWHLAVYACALFALHLAFGPRRLRRIRYLLQHRNPQPRSVP